jgi:hypothetical protein
MAQGATGTIDPFSNPIPTGMPKMSLAAILDIIKQN